MAAFKRTKPTKNYKCFVRVKLPSSNFGEKKRSHQVRRHLVSRGLKLSKIITTYWLCVPKKTFRHIDNSPRSHSGLHLQHIFSWRIQGDESFGKQQKETFEFSFPVIFNKAREKEITSSTITTTESDMRNVLIILSLTSFLKIGYYTENCHGYKNQRALIQSMLDT